MRSLNREVARMQQKFGDYSESLATPALTKVMRDRFHMTEIAQRVQAIRNGKAIEFDMLGHANDRVNEVYLAEIKTKLRQDGIDPDPRAPARLPGILSSPPRQGALRHPGRDRSAGGHAAAGAQERGSI